MSKGATSITADPGCAGAASPFSSGELALAGRAIVEEAIGHARRIPDDPAYSVHHCRKAIKRLRALVQLGRSSGARWRHADHILRHAGRLLAEARDADVLTRTVTKLREHEGRADLHTTAVSHTRPAPAEVTVAAVIDLIETAAVDVERLLAEGDWSVDSCRSGVEAGYRKMQKSMRHFRRHERESDAHDWRKGVQRYANQIRLLERLVTDDAREQLEPLDELAGYLGDYQDLTVLRAALESGWARAGRRAKARLVRSARARQRELRSDALKLGDALLAGACCAIASA